MPEGGFEIGADLDAHASQLDGVVEQLQQAVEAARQVSMPTDAYGILCQPFRMLLDPVEEHGIEALTESVKAMQAQADKVRRAAEAYRATEDAHAESLGGIDV